MKLTEITENAPGWTQLTVPDPAAAIPFYRSLFGWEAGYDGHAEVAGYSAFSLGGLAAAGLMAAPASVPANWGVVLTVPDAEAAAHAVTDAGGTVVAPVTRAGSGGWFAVFADPAGAVFSVWQADGFRGAGAFNEPGTLGWIELATSDPAGAQRFYPEVFGWTVHAGEGYSQFGIDEADFGGVTALPPGMQGPYWMPYFAVADIDAAVAVTEAEGGRVVLAPRPIGDVRTIAVVIDPQGAALGLYREH